MVSVMRVRYWVRKPWSTWMPSKYNLVADSGIAIAVTTRPAGASPHTASVSTRRHAGRVRPLSRSRIHSHSNTATTMRMSSEPAVANARVTIDTLNAASDTCFNTKNARSATTPPAMAATPMRAMALGVLTASGAKSS